MAFESQQITQDIKPAVATDSRAVPVLRRPLASLDVAAWYLGWRLERVFYWIENCKLPVFDIRRENSTRTCLRTYTPAIMALATVGRAPRYNVEAMITHILPGSAERFTAPRASFRLCCSTDHVVNLIEDGLLKRTDGKVDRQSMEEFLKSRCVTLSL